MAALERLFKLQHYGTTVRVELMAGLTTFLTMSYILVVNPQILARAGMPFDGVLFATCVASGIATLLMGLLANLPVALAPGMGLNAFFAFTVAPMLLKMGVVSDARGAWRAALGAVFISGVLFLVLCLFKVRESLINAIPDTLKLSISAGIGLFIAFIGFKEGGLVKADPVTLVTIGDLRSPAALLTLGGLAFNAVLLARGKAAGLLVGMLAVTIVALAIGEAPMPERVLAFPNPHETAFTLDIAGAFRAGLFTVIFAFFFVDLFDSVGTLVGVAQQGHLFDARGQVRSASRALLTDAIGTIVGALLGTSTIVSYIESAAGIAAGGRTGLTSVVTALLFGCALWLAPLFKVVPKSATAPVLILVGVSMFRNLKQLRFDDVSDVIPAFLVIAGMAFTNRIGDGMAFGFLSYPLIKALSGKARDVSLLMWVLFVVFAARYVFLRH